MSSANKDGGKTAAVNAVVQSALDAGHPVFLISPEDGTAGPDSEAIADRIAGLASTGWFEGLVAHTRPRLIPAGYVRDGDEVATYPGTGLLAGPEKAVADWDYRGQIVWVQAALYEADFDAGRHGIRTRDGQFLPAEADRHVVIRESVAFDDQL